MDLLTRLLVCVVPAAVCATQAAALSLQEIEQRLMKLEKENAALKEKLKRVDQLLKEQGIDPDNPLTERTVTASTSDASESLARERTARQRLEFAYKEMSDDLSRIKLQGFLSAGLSYNDEPGGLRYRPYGFNNNADFNSDSVLGVQADFRVNEKYKTSFQMVANGWEQWDPDIEWAYVAYDVTDQLSFRAGRMRLPLYLYSESLDVGYSYVWVRPPLSLYATEISNYDGFDVTYKMNSNRASHRASAFVGSYTFSWTNHQRDTDVVGDDVFGLNWTTYWSNWTYRLSYAHLRTTAFFRTQQMLGRALQGPDTVAPPNTSSSDSTLEVKASEKLNYYGFAAAYDDGNWLAVIEGSNTDVGEANFIGDNVQGVITLGHHIGALTPYIGYGREYYKDALDRDSIYASSLNRDYKLNFAGIRYDITPGIAAKFEWNRFYDFNASTGPFESAPTLLRGGKLDSVDIYTFLIDVVF